MEIETVQTAGATEIRISGTIDIYHCLELKSILKDLASQPEIRIVANMEKVDFMDSAGLGAFIAGFQAIQKNGGSLEFINLNDSVAKIFRLTRLDTTWKNGISKREKSD